MNKLKDYRKKMGLTQVELSKAINISQGALSGYETGRYEPDIQTMRRLADFFDVTLDDLFGVVMPDPVSIDSMSDIEYALSGEIRNMSEDEKKDLLDYVRFKRAQKSKRK